MYELIMALYGWKSRFLVVSGVAGWKFLGFRCVKVEVSWFRGCPGGSLVVSGVSGWK